MRHPKAKKDYKIFLRSFVNASPFNHMIRDPKMKKDHKIKKFSGCLPFKSNNETRDILKLRKIVGSS
jgi:hypothetical protein